MDQMGAVNSELEELFPEKKRVRNPLVSIGAFMTAGVLTAGLVSFRQKFSFGSETDEGSCGRSRCYGCANGWDCLLIRGKVLRTFGGYYCLMSCIMSLISAIPLFGLCFLSSFILFREGGHDSVPVCML